MMSRRKNDAKKIVAGDSTRQFAKSGGGLPSLNILDVGKGMLWDGSKWEAQSIPSRIFDWRNDVDYFLHEVVRHEGQIWLNVSSSNKNYEPKVESHHWKKISNNPVRWDFSTTYRTGQMVYVPWSTEFLTTGRRDSFHDSNIPVTLWLCVADAAGDVPVSPNEPGSISDVPPGQYIKTNYGNQNPGAVVAQSDSAGSWQCLTPPFTIMAANITELGRHQNPVVPGCHAICYDTLRVYEYTGKPGLGTYNGPVEEAEPEGWHFREFLTDKNASYYTKLSAWNLAQNYKPNEMIRYNDRVYYASVEITDGVEPNPDTTKTDVKSKVRIGRLISSFGAAVDIDALRVPFPSTTKKGDYHSITLPVSYTPSGGPFTGVQIPSGSYWFVAVGTLGGAPLQHGGWVMVPNPPAGLTEIAVDDPRFTSNPWIPLPYATKTELMEAITPLVTGIKHGVAATAIVNDPPTAPGTGNTYIIGKSPTGIFQTHANKVALWDGTQWSFSDPQKDEAHLNQADNTIYHWSGTEWNKIGSTGAAKLSELADVDITTLAPTKDSTVAWSGSKWVTKPLTSKLYAFEFSPREGMQQVIIPDEYVGRIHTLDLEGSFTFSQYDHVAFSLFTTTNHTLADLHGSYLGMIATVQYHDAVAQHWANADSSDYDKWCKSAAAVGTWFGENSNDSISHTAGGGWFDFKMRVRLTQWNGLAIDTEYNFLSYTSHVYWGRNRYLIGASTTTPFQNLSGIQMWGGATNTWNIPDANNVFAGGGEIRLTLR